MNLSFYIAKRYLFSKKSHNAINVISMVAVCGITVATIAMVCSLSVLNGFQGLVSTMFSSFDPELKITPEKGKTFDTRSEKIMKLKSIPEIALFSEVLEDNVLLRYKGRQVPATIKGVSDNFEELTEISKVLIDGDFQLKDEVNNFGTLGVGLAMNLGMNAGFAYPLEVYAPKRNSRVNLSNVSSSFSQDYIYITGVFSINQPIYDEQVLIAPISMVRTLFDYQTEVSALELKLKPGSDLKKMEASIQNLLGDEFKVQNRYQQQGATFNMMNMEKLMIYLIMVFILVIALFNVTSSLTMLIVEKQEDVLILRNIGAENKLISRIFLFEGWMISIIGAFSGIVLGVLLCLGQQKFGWLHLGDSNGIFVVNAYPVQIALNDLIFILITVLSIGFLAALYPARYLSRKWLK